MPVKTLKIEYFAILREQAGTAEETLESSAASAADLFAELRARHGFAEPSNFKVAVNDEFSDWGAVLNDGDRVVFIPPVAGG